MQRKDTLPDLTHRSLLKKLDEYLYLKREYPLFGEGACNGLAIIWLQKMSEKNSRSYLALLQRIVAEKDVRKFQDDIDVLKLISQLRFAQSPANFLATTRQFHVHEVLEVPKCWYQTGYFTTKKISECLQSHSEIGSGFLIHSLTSEPHAVAVFRDNDGYHYFDANDFNPTVTISEDEIIQKIKTSLFTMFKLPIKNWMELTIVTTRPKPKVKYEEHVFTLFCPLKVEFEGTKIERLPQQNQP